MRDDLCLKQVKDNSSGEDKAHSRDTLKVDITGLKVLANEREMLGMASGVLVQMTGWMETSTYCGNTGAMGSPQEKKMDTVLDTVNLKSLCTLPGETSRSQLNMRP